MSKNKKKKKSQLKLAELVIEAVLALAALITSIAQLIMALR